MSDTPGWASPGRPDNEDRPGARASGEQPPENDTSVPPAWPPAPGWSAQQPPAYPSAPPVGAPGTASAPPGYAGPGGQGWAGTPGGWGAAPPGPGTTAGWGPAPGWQQPAPDIKPGIVPLRPLGLGELLDGAIQAMRANPRVMLGLSAIVVTLSQAVQVLGIAILTRPFESLDATEQISDAQLIGIVAGGGATLLVGGILTFVVQVILTGILTVVVSRAVLGQAMTAADAWRTVRPRLWPLIGLTLLVVAVVSAAVLVGAFPALLVALVGGPGWLIAVVAVLGVLAGLVAAVWLYVSLALASPALVLEKQRVVAAMRRSRILVKNAWWRTFGILLLTAILVLAISAAVSFPFTALSLFFGGENGTSLPALILNGLAGVVAGVITFPFAAGVTVLLYVDRRIRREGLDLELARAAGVTIPGRTTGFGGDTGGSALRG
jgi:hypothetical protein